MPAPPPVQSTSAAMLAVVLAWFQNITVHGYADIYYAFNFNQPDDHANFIPGTGTSAKRHNEFGLNLVALDVALAVDEELPVDEEVAVAEAEEEELDEDE